MAARGGRSQRRGGVASMESSRQNLGPRRSSVEHLPAIASRGSRSASVHSAHVDLKGGCAGDTRLVGLLTRGGHCAGQPWAAAGAAPQQVSLLEPSSGPQYFTGNPRRLGPVGLMLTRDLREPHSGGRSLPRRDAVR
eukprot:CAMPEP_0115311808 /NCGR_PEP_ID=MMETSP0270-20121206/75544_1 /TAXON_ID=71861 /ORGANISM="Scrippsiella trochoidea, Strain CCMP3099" /LENGTH=136 /DNA_ID=CAMNT_0002730687 /DNA_START=109 /DNA_END=519 /DNA_ORIENTATION=-